MGGERATHAGTACTRPVVARSRRADQADAAVAERDEPSRERLRGGLVVEADARMPPLRIDTPREDIRTAMALEQRVERRVVVEAHEREGVDAVLDQLLG